MNKNQGLLHVGLWCNYLAHKPRRPNFCDNKLPNEDVSFWSVPPSLQQILRHMSHPRQAYHLMRETRCLFLHGSYSDTALPVSLPVFPVSKTGVQGKDQPHCPAGIIVQAES